MSESLSANERGLDDLTARAFEALDSGDWKMALEIVGHIRKHFGTIDRELLEIFGDDLDDVKTTRDSYPDYTIIDVS
ncbi:MAG: hypothetical protein AAB489_01815 [Patescibacteria group bacterium]